MTNKKRNQDSRYHVPNLERAFDILDLLSQSPEGMTIAEITNELEVPKNSVFRITRTLENRGYLLRDEDTKKFILSRKLLALGYSAVGEENLIEKSLDILRRLRDLSEETVLIGVLLSGEGVVLEQVVGKYPFKFYVDPGSRFPLNTAAPSKAIIAFLPPSEQQEIVDKMSFPKFTGNTITNARDFMVALTRIREVGYSVDDEEEIIGAQCVGAPIFDVHGYPKAAIWLTGPTKRVSRSSLDEIGQLVKEHADMISKRLGYFPSKAEKATREKGLEKRE